ncbi:MAG TPA: carbamate kinase [Synergistaceae bacterium]|nr:carbamate kinase [Synergistaceae bacterium]HPQ36976.1 carbamate kinase [Synergistaceae bacterium]
MSKRVVVALGGNAILQRGQKGTAEDQMASVYNTAVQIVRMIEAGYEVILTHGNGPQVGAILIQNELGSRQVPAMPMDVCGSETQGFIGYMFCQSLRNIMTEKGLKGHEPVCVVTQVEVDSHDPAFENPSKPVGPFFTEEEAQRRIQEKGEHWIEDSGRGWRRVVPSPNPKHIVEIPIIRQLVEAGSVVVASGGGGIPVVSSEKGLLSGVEAVIDKDLAGQRLAQEVGAHLFMILTDVPNVALHYNTENEVRLGEVSVEEMESYQKEGHFKAGSMGPKVEATLRFVRNGGECALIANLEQALDALQGKAGTRIIKK